MVFRLIRTALLCGFAARAFGAGPAASIPNTPAGHVLTNWLDAFNSGDRAAVDAFAKVHIPWWSTDRQIELRQRTGGFDLAAVEAGGNLWITVRLVERTTAKPVHGSLVVRPDDLDHVSLLSLPPSEASPNGFALDEKGRASVIASAATMIERHYVFPDVGKKVAADLAARQTRREYSGIVDGAVFAARLSDDLAATSGDKHFQVDYFAQGSPPQPTGSRPTADPKRVAANNCGFQKAEHLSPNIGLLRIDSFEEPSACASTAIAAMNFLATSDVLIVDLRNNAGGSPPMAALLSSFLFKDRTHLGDVFDRTTNTTEERWTDPAYQGSKLADKPVYVLTAKRTFSTGEEFSFDLKNLHRATLIGERTGGGAHTVGPHRLDDHFYIRVPFGRMFDPVTKADWEGVGVEPDVTVAATDALDDALRRARGSSPSP